MNKNETDPRVPPAAFRVATAERRIVGDMKTHVQRYRIDRRQIGFVKFILEGYDNMAVMTTTHDAQPAQVAITAAPGCEELVSAILDSLADEAGVVRLDEDPIIAWSASTRRQHHLLNSDNR